MRLWLARQMMRPWVYRITCLVVFVAIMAGLRAALQALKDTHDTPLMAMICLPLIASGIALAFWLERRGY